MSNATTKPQSLMSADNALQGAYNQIDSTFSVNGFLVGQVGHKVTLVIASNVETYTFTDNGTTLYVITITYTDATRETMTSAERTS